MGVVVTFDPVAWAARYPEFGPTSAQPVSAALAQQYFNEATIYLRNDGGGPVNTASIQSALLNMLTAHIAALNAANALGQPASPLVGRVSAATQGSESVTTEFNKSDAVAWFGQTKYGAAFWEATKQYRTMAYLPGPRARQIGGFPRAQGIPGVGNIFPW